MEAQGLLSEFGASKLAAQIGSHQSEFFTLISVNY
jgi:hypothetical protein